MGYELRAYIGDVVKHPTNIDGVERFWMNVVAEIDLCKLGTDSAIGGVASKYMGKVSKEEEGIPVYIFESDGNTRTIKDRYDDELVAIPFDEVFQAAKKDYESSDYRRTRIFYDMLVAFELHYKQKLHVVFFGH